MKQMNLVPPAHRWIEALSVGLLFGDYVGLKCPSDEWCDSKGAARFVANASSKFVGFRRFVYDPECGKKYMDPGWVYFKGVKINKEDVISGIAQKEHKELEVTDILRSNVKSNNFDIIWFRDEHRVYPFYDDDVFIDGIK